MWIRAAILLLMCLPAGAAWVEGTRTNFNWLDAGVVGGITRRTTIYTNFGTSATAAQINSAISTCPSNQVVLLTNGTFNFASGSVLNLNKSGVTLRGAGVTNNVPATKIVFQGGIGDSVAHVNVTSEGSGMFWTEPGRFLADYAVNVTSGYSRGSTQLVVSSSSGFAAGQIVMMDQEADGTYFPTTGCGGEGACNTWNRATCRQLTQWFRVVSVDGTTINVWPSVLATNWVSSATPQLCRWDGNLIERAGIEDIGFDTESSTGRPLEFAYAYTCWLSNVWWRKMDGEGIRNYGTLNCEATHCYLTGHQDTNNSGTYFFLVGPGSGFRVVNNTFVDYHNAVQISGHSGGVFAFNYFTNDTFVGQSWNFFPHNGGTSHNLVEGNHADNHTSDCLQGESLNTVVFRNYFHGDNGTGWSIRIMLTHNLTVIGNILGTSQAVYESATEADPADNYDWEYYDNDARLDSETTNSVIRDWNWCSAISTNSGIVDDATYSGTVPDSLAYASKPAWFGDRTWPWISPTTPTLAVTTNLPAGYRFAFGTNPPALGGGVSAPSRLRVLNQTTIQSIRGK